MKNSYLYLMILISSSCYFQCSATVIDVPSDYTTIQAAINASSDGDTVLAEPGIYFENINFRGHLIVLTSRYYLNNDTSFICSTIINGSQPPFPDTASCIILNSSEDSTTVIQGFTITGGAGTKWLDVHGAGTYREGGGILTEFSSPVIRYNHIINNIVTNTSGVVSTGGGGMRCGDGHPYIYNNVIAYNQGRYGGGVVYNYCNGAFLKNNLIAYNSGGQSFGGGGVWATGTNNASVIYIHNNSIVNNHVTGTGNYGGRGGGIFVFSISLQTKNNIVWGNTQSAGNCIATFSGGTVTTDYSDIDFTATGNGNINADPLFVDTVLFLLSTNSPCIDGGDTIALDNDLTSSPNIALFPSHGTERNDIGAYGGPLAHVNPLCSLTSAAINENDYCYGISIYPNPADHFISIRSSKEEILKVKVFSMAGETIFCSDYTNGQINIPLMNITDGIYVVEMVLKNKVLAKKIVVN
jgi:hypothetical protein